MYLFCILYTLYCIHEPLYCSILSVYPLAAAAEYIVSLLLYCNKMVNKKKIKINDNLHND